MGWCSANKTSALSLMYQKTCDSRKLLFTKRNPSTDMCCSSHFVSPLFVLLHLVNWKREHTVTIVLVWSIKHDGQIMRNYPAFLTVAGCWSDYSVEVVSGSPAWVSLGWHPFKSQHKQFLAILQLPHSEQREICYLRLCLYSPSGICFVMEHHKVLKMIHLTMDYGLVSTQFRIMS